MMTAERTEGGDGGTGSDKTERDRSKTEAIDTGSGGNGRGTSTPVSRRSLSIHYDGLNGYVQPRALPANTTQPRLGRQK